MLAVLIGAPTRGLAGVDVDLANMAALVRAHGGEPVVLPRATLPEIRDALAALVERCTADDPVLLYLSGHGGMYTNPQHDPLAVCPAPSELAYFVTVAAPGRPDDLLFDLELSLWCARLAGKTRNVTAILDCCHSGRLVRDDASPAEDARRVAAFLAWRAAHQQEIDSLDVEAHPDVVRLSAAGISGFGRMLADGSALTGVLMAELAAGGARSWVAMLAGIERRLAAAGVPQRPRLSGPVRRRVFSLAEALPPGALAVRRDDHDRLVLEAGGDHGVRRGDLFLMASAKTTRVCHVDALTPTSATLRPRGDDMSFETASFVVPLHLQGHGAVTLAGPESATRPLARALQRAHWEVGPATRRDGALALLTCTADAIVVRDPSGDACISFAADDFDGCIAALQRLARAARLQHLGSGRLSAHCLKATWGRVRAGVCERLASSGAELDASDAIFVRLENHSDRRRFVSVFWLADDGEAALLSRSESMGIELLPRTTHILGARPFASKPRGAVIPRRPLAPGEHRHERLAIVATTRRHALWNFESGRPDRPYRHDADAPCVELFAFTVTA